MDTCIQIRDTRSDLALIDKEQNTAIIVNSLLRLQRG
jgi:hypothetical protein